MSEMVQDGYVVTTHHKQEVSYGLSIHAIPMTLKDLEGHSSVQFNPCLRDVVTKHIRRLRLKQRHSMPFNAAMGTGDWNFGSSR